MSKIKLTGSNSGYVEISSAADAGNLTLALPTSGTELLSNGNNVYTGITTFSNDVKFEGASYDVLWDKSDNQLEFGDNTKISFGTDADLQVSHNNTHAIVRNSTGRLYILADDIWIKDGNDGDIHARFLHDDACELRFDNDIKLETTNTGVTVTGIVAATSFSGSGENLTRTTPYSHRNKFINGSFAIWQRGTSSTSTGYLADRWYFGLSGGSATCSRQEHSGSQANFSGSQYYLRLAVTSASDYIGIRQRIEDVRTLPEGQITVSFWARGHVNANLAVWMTLNFGSGGSTDVDIAQQVTPYLQNDSTFRYYSLTFTVPSISGKTIGAGSYFQISFGQGTNNSSSAWTLDISNIQVEVGSVATPFEHRSVGEELQRCKRYFARHGWDSQNGVQKVRIIPGINEHAANYGLYVNFGFDVEMRVQPTVTFGSNVTVGRPQVAVGRRINSTSTGLNSPSGIGFMKWPTSGTYGGQLGSHGDAYYYVKIGNDSDAYIDCSAEL